MAYKTFVPQETPVDKNATVRTNYYQTINKKWLERQKSSDQPSMVFYELNEQVKDKMKADIKNLVWWRVNDWRNCREFIQILPAGYWLQTAEKDG